MTDKQASGVALIAGSVGSIITMGLHPSGRVAPEQMESMVRMLIGVHALALASTPVLFIGALGLSWRSTSRDRLTTAALVFYTFALLAVMNAAVADGLVTPNIFRQMVASAGAPAAIDGWRMVSRYNFYVNQGYAQVFVAASSLAIILWSIAILRKRDMSQALGIYGCVLGTVTLLALFSGHLRLDTHGFGVVALGQAIWFIVAGALLWTSDEKIASAAS
jgi:hypothetical protein